MIQISKENKQRLSNRKISVLYSELYRNTSVSRKKEYVYPTPGKTVMSRANDKNQLKLNLCRVKLRGSKDAKGICAQARPS